MAALNVKRRIRDQVVVICRVGFKEHWTLGYLSFWGPTQVWSIWSLVFQAWMSSPLTCSAPSKFCLLWCRLWFYDCP